MSQSDQYPWTYEVEDNVVICDQRGWSEGSEEEIEALMGQFAELAGPDHVTASLTMVDSDVKLDGERQQKIEEASPTYERLGIERLALVADGITGMALASLVDLPPGMELRTFDDRSAAMEWCRDG